MLRGVTKPPTTLAACLTLTLLGSCGPDKPSDAGDAGAPPAQQAAAPASNKPAVAGVYKLDVLAMQRLAMAALPEDADADAAVAMLNGIVKKFSGTITLQADGTAAMAVTMPISGVTETSSMTSGGTWALDGDQLTITAKNEEADDARALTLKGDTLTLVEGAGPSAMTLVFRKKAPK